LYEFDLIEMQSDTGTETALSAARIEDGELILGPIKLMQGSWVGMQTIVEPFTVLPAYSKLDDLSCMERGMKIEGQSAIGALFSGSPPNVVENGYTPVFGGRGAWFVIWSLIQWIIITFIRSGMLVIALAPSFLVFGVISQSLGKGYAIGALSLLAMMAMVSIMVCVILVKWLVMWRVSPGSYSRWGFMAFRRQLFRHTYSFLDNFGFIHQQSSWLQVFYRLMGSSIGSDVLLGLPFKMLDFDLMELKHGAFTAAQTYFKTWHISGDKLVLEKVTIGESAWAGTGCLLQPGAYLPNNSAAAGLTLVTKGDHAECTSLKGAPCSPMGSIQQIPYKIGYYGLLETCVQIIYAIVAYILFGFPLIAGYFIMDSIYLAMQGLYPVALTVPSLPEYWYYQAFVFSFTFNIAVIGVTVGVIIIAIIVRSLIMSPIGPDRPIYHPQRRYWLTNVMESFVWIILGTIGGGSEWMNFTLRGLGAKVGERAYIDPILIADPPMLNFGRACSVRQCLVEAHAPPHGKWLMEFGPVRIGAYSSVERGSLIIYPIDISPHVKIRPVTRGLVGERYEGGSSWGGSVASKITDDGKLLKLVDDDYLGEEIEKAEQEAEGSGFIPQLLVTPAKIVKKSEAVGSMEVVPAFDDTMLKSDNLDLDSLENNDFEELRQLEAKEDIYKETEDMSSFFSLLKFEN
jgi:non-ribosomal peptide synthetase-like protein